MKALKAQEYALAGFLILFGCRPQQNSSVVDMKASSPTTESETHRAHEENAVHNDEHQHQSHQHAFSEPDKLAAKWNDPSRDEWQHPEEIVEALNLKKGAIVADIGAGTGYMVAHLSQAVGEAGTVIAIDAEAAMVDYLTRHSSELGPATIVPQKVGFHDPDLRTESVDAVLILDTWHHMTERESYARKVYAGLKPGGRIVIVDYRPDAESGPPKSMRLAASEVISQLKSVGFDAKVVEVSMPRHFLIVGRKK